jgi:hypothetical protein
VQSLRSKTGTDLSVNEKATVHFFGITFILSLLASRLGEPDIHSAVISNCSLHFVPVSI